MFDVDDDKCSFKNSIYIYPIMTTLRILPLIFCLNISTFQSTCRSVSRSWARKQTAAAAKRTCRSPGLELFLGYIGDYTTHLCRDYNKPLETTSMMDQPVWYPAIRPNSSRIMGQYLLGSTSTFFCQKTNAVKLAKYLLSGGRKLYTVPPGEKTWSFVQARKLKAARAAITERAVF